MVVNFGTGESQVRRNFASDFCRYCFAFASHDIILRPGVGVRGLCRRISRVNRFCSSEISGSSGPNSAGPRPEIWIGGERNKGSEGLTVGEEREV